MKFTCVLMLVGLMAPTAFGALELISKPILDIVRGSASIKFETMIGLFDMSAKMKSMAAAFVVRRMEQGFHGDDSVQATLSQMMTKVIQDAAGTLENTTDLGDGCSAVLEGGLELANGCDFSGDIAKAKNLENEIADVAKNGRREIHRNKAAANNCSKNKSGTIQNVNGVACTEWYLAKGFLAYIKNAAVMSAKTVQISALLVKFRVKSVSCGLYKRVTSILPKINKTAAQCFADYFERIGETLRGDN